MKRVLSLLALLCLGTIAFVADPAGAVAPKPPWPGLRRRPYHRQGFQRGEGETFYGPRCALHAKQGRSHALRHCPRVPDRANRDQALGASAMRLYRAIAGVNCSAPTPRWSGTTLPRHSHSTPAPPPARPRPPCSRSPSAKSYECIAGGVRAPRGLIGAR